MPYLIEQTALKNFKGLQTATVNFVDETGEPLKTFYIVGKNGTGKTTIIHSIIFALEGLKGFGMLKKQRYEMIGQWGKTAQCSVSLKDPKTNKKYTIVRKMSKSSEALVIRDAAGEAMSDDFLDNLLSEYTFNLRQGFLQASPQEQAKFLGIDTEKVDAEIADADIDLKTANKEKLKAKKKADTFTTEDREPVKSVDIKALYEKKGQIKSFNNLQEQRTYGKAALREKIKELEEKLSKAKTQLDTLDEPESLRSLESVQQQINTSDERNMRAIRYNEFVSAEQDLEAKTNEWKEKREAKNTAMQKRTDYLKKTVPFSNVSIDDEGGLLVNERKLNEQTYNTAEAIKLALKILLQGKKRLPVFFISDGGSFDEDEKGRAEMLEDLAKTKDLQFFVELRSKEKPKMINSIHLESAIV